jgi:hypothetical protein
MVALLASYFATRIDFDGNWRRGDIYCMFKHDRKWVSAEDRSFTIPEQLSSMSGVNWI